MNKQHTFTPEGYNKLKDEYRQLTEERRPETLERLSDAREMGNLEDNLQYEAVKSELELIDARIAELDELLKNAKVVEGSEQEAINVGSRVKVEIDGEKETYIIVNPYESNPADGKISYESPVGKALIDKQPGEEVTVKLPHTEIKYRIIEIVQP